MAGEQKMLRMALTAMVVGGMTGAGNFPLPRSFANATGPLGAVVAWPVAGSGMYVLARAFQTLAERRLDRERALMSVRPSHDLPDHPRSGEVLNRRKHVASAGRRISASTRAAVAQKQHCIVASLGIATCSDDRAGVFRYPRPAGQGDGFPRRGQT